MERKGGKQGKRVRAGKRLLPVALGLSLLTTPAVAEELGAERPPVVPVEVGAPAVTPTIAPMDVETLLAEMGPDAVLARQQVDEYRAAFGMPSIDELQQDIWAKEKNAAAPLFAGKFAMMAAKTILNGAKMQATGLAFQEMIGAFGYGGEEMAALASIQASLDQLHEQMTVVLDTLQQVLDQSTWDSFVDANNEVATRAGEISAWLLDYRTWEDTGFVPDEQYVRNTSLLIYQTLGQLSGALNDPTSGSVALLLKAAGVEQNVSNLQKHWDMLEYYRDFYSGVYAEALIVLSQIEPYDPSGSVAQRLYASEILALETLHEMNDAMGVPIFQTESGSQYIHVIDKDWVWTDGSRPNFPRESWSRINNRGQFETYINQIREQFRASSHGVANLEEFFDKMNLRKSFDPLDTFRIDIVSQGKAVFYQARHDRLEIKGNDLRSSIVSDGDMYNYHFDSSAYFKASMDSLNARNAVQNGPAQGRIMNVELNSGGRAAWFEDDWVDSQVVGVAGLEVDRYDEFNAVQVTIDDPFETYPRVELKDGETGKVFASVGKNQPFVTVEIPPNGEKERLIVVEQGQNTGNSFYARAQSGFGIDGTETILMRVNDSPTNLEIRSKGDGKVTVRHESGEILCEEVSSCTTNIPWDDDVIVTPVDGALGIFSHWEGNCDEGEDEGEHCLFTHTPNDREVVAVFETPTSNITMEFDWDAWPEGDILHNGQLQCTAPQTCTKAYPTNGGDVTLKAAVATKRNDFSHWSGACKGSNPTCTVDPTKGDVRVKAHYKFGDSPW